MENEENRGVINKKAYEYQFVTFCQFSFGALSLFSLSHSWTLRVFLENSSFGEMKGKTSNGRTRKGRKVKIKQGRVGSSGFSRNTCK